MDVNVLVVSGNLVRPAELRYGASGAAQGKAILNFTIANSPYVGGKKATTFYDVTLWEKNAEYWAQILCHEDAKGKKLTVSGVHVHEVQDGDQGQKYHKDKILNPNSIQAHFDTRPYTGNNQNAQNDYSGSYTPQGQNNGAYPNNPQGQNNTGFQSTPPQGQNNRYDPQGNPQGQGFPNQQGQGFPNQQGQGFPNQQGQGIPNQQGQGYPNQQGQGYPNQQGQGFPNQQGQGFPNQQGFNPNNFGNGVGNEDDDDIPF